MIDVSIIIVNWNTKDLLVDCINIIKDQIKTIKFEIIVVDNNSTDGSQSEIRKKFKDVLLITNDENLGFSKANNIGLKYTNGKYICLLNSDTAVLDNALDKMYAFMEQNKNTGILGPAILNDDQTVRKTCRTFPNLRTEFNWAFRLDKIFPNKKFSAMDLMTYFPHDKTLSVDVVPGSCMFIRKEVIDSEGMLDERFFFYAEDVDICIRYKKKGWNIIYFPDAKIIHYGGRSTSKAPLRFAKQLLIANIQYWKKHYGKLKLACYFLIKFLHYSIRLVAFILLYTIQRNDKKENYEQIIVNKECIKHLMPGFASIKRDT